MDTIENDFIIMPKDVGRHEALELVNSRIHLLNLPTIENPDDYEALLDK